jgi:hypothetical protein
LQCFWLCHVLLQRKGVRSVLCGVKSVAGMQLQERD